MCDISVSNSVIHKKKKVGRPKKIINYDAVDVIKFIKLFGDFNSWDELEGKIIKYSELLERDIYTKFIENDMKNKLNKVLPTWKFRKLAKNGKIENINDLIDLLRSIAVKKNIKVCTAYCEYKIEAIKLILFEKI